MNARTPEMSPKRPERRRLSLGLAGLALSIAVIASCQSSQGPGLLPHLTIGGPNASNPQVVMGTFDASMLSASRTTGELTFSLKGIGPAPAAHMRTVQYTTAQINSVTVIVQPNNAPQVSQTITAAQISAGTGSVTFLGLPPGNANVIVSAFDASGNQIGGSSSTIAVSSGVTTTVSLSVVLDPSYVTAPGGLQTTITFSNGPTITGTPKPSPPIAPTGTLVATLQANAGPDNIVVDQAGNVWAGLFGNNSIAIYSATTRALLSTMQLGGAGSTIQAGPLAVDGTNNVWIGGVNTTSAYKLSATGAIAGTDVVGPNPSAMLFDTAGNLWCANYLVGTVTKVSPTGVPLGSFSVHPTVLPSASPMPSVTGVPGGYYLGQTPPINKGGIFSSPSPTALAFDTAGNLWVTLAGTDGILVLNPTTGKQLAYFALPSGAVPMGLVFDASGNAWVTESGLNSVIELSPSGVQLQTIAVGKSPEGIVKDHSGNFWVANNLLGTVSELTSGSGKLIGSYNTGGLQPRHLAVDGRGLIWVTNYGSNTVAVLAP